MREGFARSLQSAAARITEQAREAQYVTNPVLWAEDRTGAILWSKQKEMLMSLVHNKRTAVKSSPSIGKTHITGLAAAWWIETRVDCMVQSTAPTYKQVHALLWEWLRKMHTEYNLRGRITLGDQWLVPMQVGGRVQDVLVAEGKKPADTNIHGFQGTHRKDGVLAALDEAGGLPQQIFTGAEAITTASFDRILAVGNPDDPNTEFARIFADNPEWNTMTISVWDTPNFTGEAEEMLAHATEFDKANDDLNRTRYNKVIKILDSLPKPEWVESRKRDWGEESPLYVSKVHAQFPRASMDSMFTATDIERGLATEITPKKEDFRVFGVDIARYGKDKTVIASNVAGKIDIIGSYQSMDLMEIASTVHKLALDRKVDQVRVDGIGPGGGVVDRLVGLSRAADRPYVVVEMTASAMAPDRTIHRNARAYWYDTLKYQLRNERIDLPNDGPESDQLRRELGGIKYGYPNGILQIESKEDIRKRGDKSPDYVDAVVMATAPVGYVADDPLATARKGQMLSVDVVPDIELVSPY